jgi:hypothetical protein
MASDLFVSMLNQAGAYRYPSNLLHLRSIICTHNLQQPIHALSMQSELHKAQVCRFIRSSFCSEHNSLLNPLYQGASCSTMLQWHAMMLR